MGMFMYVRLLMAYLKEVMKLWAWVWDVGKKQHKWQLCGLSKSEILKNFLMLAFLGGGEWCWDSLFPSKLMMFLCFQFDSLLYFIFKVAYFDFTNTAFLKYNSILLLFPNRKIQVLHFNKVNLVVLNGSTNSVGFQC